MVLVFDDKVWMLPVHPPIRWAYLGLLVLLVAGFDGDIFLFDDMCGWCMNCMSSRRWHGSGSAKDWKSKPPSTDIHIAMARSVNAEERNWNRKGTLEHSKHHNHSYAGNKGRMKIQVKATVETISRTAVSWMNTRKQQELHMFFLVFSTCKLKKYYIPVFVMSGLRLFVALVQICFVWPKLIHCIKTEDAGIEFNIRDLD